MERTQRSSLESEQKLISERVLEVTRKFFDRLAHEETRGLRYAVVGGMALTAHSGQKFEPLRTNGTKRDIDIIVLADPHHIIPELHRDLQSGAFGSVCDTPPVSMDRLEVEGRSQPQNFISRHFLRVFEQTPDGKIALRYRSVQKVLNQEAVSLQHATIRSDAYTFHISTFSPVTLPFLYMTRTVGGVKSKDAEKLREYMQMLKETYGSDRLRIEALKMAEFYEFAREVQNKYPIRASIARGLHWIDKTLFDGLLSGGNIIPPARYTNISFCF